MDTLHLREAVVPEDGLSKPPRGKYAKVAGVHSSEHGVEQNSSPEGVGVQPVQSMVTLKNVSFKSAMRIPGAGGENVHWVVATDLLVLGMHAAMQCVSVTRKGVTYYCPMSNVLFFEMA